MSESAVLVSPANRPSTMYEPTPHTPTQLLLTSFRTPIASLEDLENLLLQALTGLGAVPSSSAREVDTELGRNDVLHIVPTVQHLLLSVILPTWLAPLRDAGLVLLAKTLFCPPQAKTSEDAETRCTIVVSALPTLLLHMQTLNSKDTGPTVLLDFSISLVEEITALYPADIVHRSLFQPNSNARGRTDVMDARQAREWEDYVRSACSVPGKVANALHDRSDIASRGELEHGPYFSNMCMHAERLLFRISQDPFRTSSLASQSHLLLKLLTLGLFPSTPPSLPSQPSFFSATLTTIRRRLHLCTASSEAASAHYPETWSAVIRSLPTTSQQTFVASLLGGLDCTVGTDTSARACRSIGEGAGILRGLLGKLGGDNADVEAGGNNELWGAVAGVVCGSNRTWNLGIARAVVCWVADPQGTRVDEPALERLLDTTVAVWTNPEYIRHSLLSLHRYETSLLLLTVAALPQDAGAVERLALSPPFVSSISTYIGHLDKSVRWCGMLVAEVVAARCGKKLEFGVWEGGGESLDWARTMRGWKSDWSIEGFKPCSSEDEAPPLPSPELPNADSAPPSAPRIPPAVQPESFDSDDSLTGYDSASSSRTPSPSPSELAEIEKDPTLRVGRTKPVPRPVYLAQLVALLRTDKNNDEGEAERLDVALACAEALIRRKKGFGLELEENAVELTIALVGLRDNYELAGFDEKRQGALVALVACCPCKAAMTLVEQFFTNQYSITERFVMLTALALGARALAGLPVPPSSVPHASVAFPSKMLPPALHRRYGNGEGEVQGLLRGISIQAIEKSKSATEASIPALVRERQLRVGRLGSTRVTEVARASQPDARQDMTFAAVAAEHFIVPLVNHMWQHVRDTQTRTWRGGVGTGMILGAVVLAQYLGTLAVLMHAAQHATAFLAVLAPEALEVATTLGSRRIEVDGEEGGKEAAVVTAALEVALVVLDACVELDGGRVLALEHTGLLLAVREWAGAVLSLLEGGRKVSGGGGETEGRMGGAAAGVVLKAEQVTERWDRSMVTVGL